MKIIAYNDKKTFLLTDKEASEALACWETKRSYFCDRTGESLNPFCSYVSNLPDHERFEQRVVEKDGKAAFFAYDKEKKEWWHLNGWPYDKVVSSLVGRQTYAGLLPKKIEFKGDKEKNNRELLAGTKSYDEYLDAKNK